ncbi:MAG: zinc finger domain-containing protein [Nanoarchaeota archaeon]
MTDKTCLSCKKRIVNDKGNVSFSCPGCSSYEIVRCAGCRSNAIKYQCPSCGFSGPN